MLGLLGAAGAASGQSTDPSAFNKPAAPIVAGFDGGFFIQSDDGDNRLTFGMVAQTDGRFSVDDPSPIVGTFTLRKVRPTFTGRVARYFDFRLVPDFGNGRTVVQDAYLGIRFSSAFRLRIGKDKTPVGYELLQSDPYILFPERSLASGLMPNRDIGVAAQGDIAGARVSYAAGIYNGVPDGTSSSTDVDTNGGKDLAGRLLVQPFARGRSGSLLNGLGFHVGASTGKQEGALPSFSTSVQQTYFSYAAGVAANGSRTRVAPSIFYYAGPFGAFAEYTRTTQTVAQSARSSEITNQAWDVTGSWLLTRERASYGMVRPARSFDPETRTWGALQIVARYSAFTADGNTFALGLAAASASREARQLTVGANWYATTFVKCYATFERTAFRGGARRDTEHVVLVRTQLAFGDRR